MKLHLQVAFIAQFYLLMLFCHLPYFLVFFFNIWPYYLHQYFSGIYCGALLLIHLASRCIVESQIYLALYFSGSFLSVHAISIPHIAHLLLAAPGLLT